jgi:hypothetical protein
MAAAYWNERSKRRDFYPERTSVLLTGVKGKRAPVLPWIIPEGLQEVACGY